MAEQVKVPAIRFAGFTDPWEQRKFVDFVEASGIRNKDNLQLESYSVSNDRGFVPQDEQFENGGTMRDADKTAYWIVEPGSFAYNPARINVGSIGYQSTRKNVIVSSLYEVFKTDRSCDDRFLWHWFKSSLFTKQIEMLQEGGVRLYFFFDKLQKSEIWMPNVDEQRIIGQQFDQLDSLITLHQRKYDKLVVFKKSMLEKMFPKDGESVPEIRFAGFTDPWEQRKFSDIVNVCSGKDYKHLEEGPIPVYGTGGFMTSVDEALSYDRDAVGIGRKGTIDKPYLLKAPFWTVDTLFYAIPKSDMDLEFVHCSFLNVDWKSKDESTGLPSLSKEAINETIALVPSFNEQSRIGEFFNDLDSLITLHQRKLELLQNIKKSLLDKMFV